MSYIKQPDSGGGGTIGGSIANEQVAFGSGTNTIEGTNDLKYVKGDAALKLAADDSGLLVGAGGSNFDSDFYFQVYGSESRVDSALPIRIKGSNTDTKFITECSEARTGGQNIGEVQFKGLDSASNVDKFGQIQVDAESNTSGSEDASMLFKVVGSDSGVLREVVRITKSGLTLGGNTPGDQYTLPIVDGDPNQVLQTDGSGNVTFQTVSGGASLNQALNPRDLIYSVAPSIIDTYLLSRGVGMTCVGALSNSYLTRSAYSQPRFRSFIAPKTGDVSAFLVSVATANASTNFLVGIYSQTNGLPTALMGRAEMDCSSTGEVEQTTIEDASGSSATISLTQGEMYFYAWNRTNATGDPRLHAENPAGAQFTVNQVQTVNAVDESYNLLEVSTGSANTLPATPTASQFYLGGGSSYPLRLGIKYS